MRIPALLLAWLLSIAAPAAGRPAVHFGAGVPLHGRPGLRNSLPLAEFSSAVQPLRIRLRGGSGAPTGDQGQLDNMVLALTSSDNAERSQAEKAYQVLSLFHPPLACDPSPPCICPCLIVPFALPPVTRTITRCPP